MHPLDCPIWSALTTRHADLADGGDDALRYPVDVSPLAGARDAGAAAALADLIPAGDDISLLEVAPPPPPRNAVEILRAPCVQMTLSQLSAAPPAFAIEPLGDSDAADMLALALLTKPGPFRARTHILGRFVGVRENGRLIAMAGERTATDGFIEVSAVCTHPDFRGRGLGAALMVAAAERILADGATPYLHAYTTNTTAIALYRKLGFSVRTEVQHAVWRRADA